MSCRLLVAFRCSLQDVEHRSCVVHARSTPSPIAKEKGSGLPARHVGLAPQLCAKIRYPLITIDHSDVWNSSVEKFSLAAAQPRNTWEVMGPMWLFRQEFRSLPRCRMIRCRSHTQILVKLM